MSKSDIEEDEEDELGYIYHQNIPDLSWKTCLLINSESSVDIFNNAKLLIDILQIKKPLKLHCNAGHIHVTQECWFGEIEVMYHPKGIAHILSLKTLKKRHHVTYDSRDREGVFKVHITQRVLEFMPYESGPHYLDLKENEEAVIALVMTIRETFEGYTREQVEGTIKACCLQAMLGHPSRKDYKSMVHANLIANFSVTPENISHAHKLFGKNLRGLKRKNSLQKIRASGNGLCPNIKGCETNE